MLEFISRLTIVAASLLASYPTVAPASETPRALQDKSQDTSSTIANKAAVERALQAWMSGDGGALQPLLSDEVEWTIAGNSAASGTTRGRAELMSKVLGPFGARFSRSEDRFRPRRILGVYADGDSVVAHFDGAGIANDGKPYTNSYVWLLTMRDGKVTQATAFFDSIAFNDLWAACAAGAELIDTAQHNSTERGSKCSFAQPARVLVEEILIRPVKQAAS